MTEQNNDDNVEILLWQNGKEKDFSFKYMVKNISSIDIQYLKGAISKEINTKKELISLFNIKKEINIHHLYNIREEDLEDTDIPYLKPNEVIYFTFDHSSFKPSNHYYIYQFIKWIKSGGYGQVFLAKHLLTEKIYAIKQIDTSNFSNEDLYNISREHMILRSMLHKNVIKCHDSFAYDNKYFTVMDYAEGGELTLLLKEKKKLSENDSKKIFKQIYDAVCYIHGQNIIHRDLKPSNILFLDKERTHVVIIDFGISGFANGNQREKIKAGTIIFMAPEIAGGEEYESSRKLDIWSLGIILYRMVEGVYPFDGSNIKEVIKNILKKKLEFNKKIKISLPLRTLIENLLEKNHRFRIDDNSDLFNKWFDYVPPVESHEINRVNSNKMVMKNKVEKIDEICDYLTPVKPNILNRIPTHSHSNFHKKKHSKDVQIDSMQKINDDIKNNIHFNNWSPSKKRMMPKNNLILPVIKHNSGTNNNCEVFSSFSNNNIKRIHRNSVKNKRPNFNCKSQININSTNSSKKNNEDNSNNINSINNKENNIQYNLKSYNDKNQ